MASAAPRAAAETEADLRKHINELENQLDIAYDKLSKLNGNNNQRPAKRARRDDAADGAASSVSTSNEDADKPLDARIVRWQLQQHIDNLTDQVRSQVGPNYAEGYEEQWESKLNWYDAIAAPLQNVLDIGIGKKTALKECNEVLKMIADSFDALLACGAKMDTREELSESAASFELTLPWGEKDEDGKGPSILVCTGMEVENAWLWIWVVLLRVHAALGREEDKYVLLQCIKDCRAHEVGPDYITLTLEEPLPEYLTTLSDSVIVGKVENSPDGAALAKIVKEGEWNKLRCERRVRYKPSDNLDASDDYSEDYDDEDNDGDVNNALNETNDTLNVTGETFDENGEKFCVKFMYRPHDYHPEIAVALALTYLIPDYDDEDIDDDDELNETYEDSEDYDEEEDDGDMKPAALPVGAEGDLPDDDEEDDEEGDY